MSEPLRGGGNFHLSSFRDAVMTSGPHYRHATDLPVVIPVFPLSGATLLPGGHLPLNIFEPRYLNMIDDALSADRLIGMIQPREHERRTESPPLFRVGCVGRLISFSETDDGRYLISLKGICRFQIHEELSVTTPYRQLRVDYEDYAGDMHGDELQHTIDREGILNVLKEFLDSNQLETDWESVKKTSADTLVNSLSMSCPFTPQEKQALLEAHDVNDRAHILQALLEMAAGNGTDSDDTPLQ